MAKVAFSKPGGENLATEVQATVTTVATPVEGVTVETTSTAALPASPASPGVPVVITPSASAVSRPLYADDAEENIDPGDLVIPYLSVVQKVGEMSNIYQGGTILLGSQTSGQLVLADAPKPNELSNPVRIVVLGTRPKRFVEKVEGGMRGEMFDSEQEVAAHGGTLSYDEAMSTKGTPGAKRLFQTLITALLLVEKPDHCDVNSFPFKIGGKNYALALYSMKGTSYTNAAKHFMSAKKIGWLRGVGYRGGIWEFRSQLKKYGSNFVFIPVVKPNEATTEFFRAEVASTLF